MVVLEGPQTEAEAEAEAESFCLFVPLHIIFITFSGKKVKIYFTPFSTDRLPWQTF